MKATTALTRQIPTFIEIRTHTDPQRCVPRTRHPHARKARKGISLETMGRSGNINTDHIKYNVISMFIKIETERRPKGR